MIVRRLARPMLAATFVYGGINVLQNTDRYVGLTKPFLDKTIGQDAVPADPATLVRLDAGVKIAAGTLFALGKFPRLSALALLGSLVPTTAVGHPFWEAKDSRERQQHFIHFLKNTGLAGGLLLAAADTAGKPSLGWRARRAAKKATKKAKHASKVAG